MNGASAQPSLPAFRERFLGYVAGFWESDPEGRRNVELKRDHSLQVLGHATAIAAAAGASPRLRRLAELAALFHDIGRFPQYARYRTFRDDRSVNHGHLGSRTLRGLGMLDNMPPADRLAVLGAVHCHNRRAMPRRLAPDADFATRVVRDADKLDILRVFRDHFRNPQAKDPVVTLHVAEHPANFTPAVLDMAMNGRLPDYRELRWTNDVLLLAMSWAYDLNFAASRRRMLEGGLVDEFLDMLPAIAEIKACGRRVKEHLAAGQAGEGPLPQASGEAADGVSWRPGP